MNTIAPQELSDLDFTKLQGQYQAEFGITMNKQVLLLFEMQKVAHRKELESNQNLYEQQKQESALLHQKQNEKFDQKMRQEELHHQKYTDSLDKAVVAIGKQKGAIITENPKVVVKHNLTKYGIICLTIFLLSCLGAFIYDRYYQRQEEYRKITNTLINYPKIYKYDILFQNATIETNPDGREGEFLILTIPEEGESTQAGKHYIYDNKKDRVLVPLHFSKEAHAQ